jgi:hypothetical protein
MASTTAGGAGNSTLVGDVVARARLPDAAEVASLSRSEFGRVLQLSGFAFVGARACPLDFDQQSIETCLWADGNF